MLIAVTVEDVADANNNLNKIAAKVILVEERLE
jgi:hypothetical protein